jgi:hypothetical protein
LKEGVFSRMVNGKGCRIVLTAQLAAEIYGHKIDLIQPTSFIAYSDSLRSLKGQSVPIGKKYGVSAKTVAGTEKHGPLQPAICGIRSHPITSM